MVFKVEGWNEFYDGWIAYVLGEPEPATAVADGFRAGWLTAKETSALDTVRYVTVRERELKHVSVSREGT